MAGKIVVSEILSDATSSNTVKIGSGMTLDLNAQGTTVLPTIPSSKMPAGSVLQVQSSQDTSNWSTSSTTFVRTYLCEQSITTISLNSKIYVNMLFSAQIHSGGNGAGVFSIRTSVDNYASSTFDGVAVQWTDWTQPVCGLSVVYSPGQPAGTTIEFRLYAMKAGGNNTVYINDAWGKTSGIPRSSITLMEIAG